MMVFAIWSLFQGTIIARLVFLTGGSTVTACFVGLSFAFAALKLSVMTYECRHP